jgi:hypothetical protein
MNSNNEEIKNLIYLNQTIDEQIKNHERQIDLLKLKRITLKIYF